MIVVEVKARGERYTIEMPQQDLTVEQAIQVVREQLRSDSPVIQTIDGLVEINCGTDYDHIKAHEEQEYPAPPFMDDDHTSAFPTGTFPFVTDKLTYLDNPLVVEGLRHCSASGVDYYMPMNIGADYALSMLDHRSLEAVITMYLQSINVPNGVLVFPPGKFYDLQDAAAYLEEYVGGRETVIKPQNKEREAKAFTAWNPNMGG